MLAEWLSVSAEWLRFGEEVALPKAIAHPSVWPLFDHALLDDIARLDDTSREIVEGVIALLLGVRQTS